MKRKHNRHVLPQIDGPIVRAERVCKTYQMNSTRLEILRGISLTIDKGEMVAITGASGSGKTTLLNMLSGLDEIDSGLILFEGRELAHMSDRQRTACRASRMGFVFQNYNLLPVLDAAENVELPLLLSGQKQRVARQRALNALESVGVLEWAHHRPAELSGGQRQRVAIARALVNDPGIVWADEPTGALDSHSAEQVMSLLRMLNHRYGLTIAIVTHDREIADQCDRIVTMVDGSIHDVHRNPPPAAMPFSDRVRILTAN